MQWHLVTPLSQQSFVLRYAPKVQVFELLKAAYLCRQLLNLVVEKVEHFYVSQVCDVCWHSCGKFSQWETAIRARHPDYRCFTSTWHSHCLYSGCRTESISLFQKRKKFMSKVYKSKVYIQKVFYLEPVLIAETINFVLFKNYYQNCKIFWLTKTTAERDKDKCSYRVREGGCPVNSCSTHRSQKSRAWETWIVSLFEWKKH